MSIFFTGCTHFGHSNIIKLANRPFEDVHHMDSVLIENWNRTVRQNDDVYHLGDFAWSTPERYLSKLNGRVHLIQGNHDPEGWGVDYTTLKYNKRKWVLFHYPIQEWDRFYSGSAHVHCHTHAKELVSAERRFNVGVDSTDFTPVSIDALERYIHV